VFESIFVAAKTAVRCGGDNARPWLGYNVSGELLVHPLISGSYVLCDIRRDGLLLPLAVSESGSVTRKQMF
jgi:hypothetical protein